MHLGPLLKSSLLAAMTLAFATSTSGQSTAPSGMQRVPPGTPPDRPAIRALKQIGKVEVLGDTFGVDLDSYLRTGVLPYLRGAWHNYAPRGLSTTTDKSGIAVIEFDILQGGSLANISVVSTSGVNDIDTDAISAITKSSLTKRCLPSSLASTCGCAANCSTTPADSFILRSLERITTRLVPWPPRRTMRRAMPTQTGPRFPAPFINPLRSSQIRQGRRRSTAWFYSK
jgi:hypothetical protein